MGALLVSVFSWIFRSIVIKFFVFFALYFVVSGFIGYLAAFLPSASNISSLFSAWTPAMWYFADLTGMTIGLPACISAAVTAFCIRRIPVIG